MCTTHHHQGINAPTPTNLRSPAPQCQVAFPISSSVAKHVWWECPSLRTHRNALISGRFEAQLWRKRFLLPDRTSFRPLHIPDLRRSPARCRHSQANGAWNRNVRGLAIFSPAAQHNDTIPENLVDPILTPELLPSNNPSSPTEITKLLGRSTQPLPSTKKTSENRNLLHCGKGPTRTQDEKAKKRYMHTVTIGGQGGPKPVISPQRARNAT